MPDRPPTPPLPAALLRHERPDGSVHFDLLLAESPTVGDDDRTVPTWRCAADPFELEPGDRCDASPIAPHRGVYLRLDVPRDLGDGRGRVAPIWRGTWRRVDDGVELSWSGRVTRIAWTEGGARRIR